MDRRARAELEPEGLRRQVQEAVLEGHGLRPDVCELVRQGALPRTTSGKVRRRAAREAYRAGTLGPGPAVPDA